MRRWAGILVAGTLAGCAALTPLDSPRVTLADLHVEDVGLFEQRYGLQLRVQNPNPQPLVIEGMDFRVDFDGSQFGHGVSGEPATVPAFGETVLDVVMVSNTAQLLDQLRRLEAGGLQRLQYRITGDMGVARQTTKLPFSFQGTIGMSETGAGRAPEGEEIGPQ